MGPPGPTMKTIQKRFCTALPRTLPSTSPASPSKSRARSNSALPSRSLYTSHSVPLGFFDSPPPPPPPSSRPGHPHILSTSRLPVKEGEGSTSHHTQASPHNHGQPCGQPPFSIALTSPQANHTPIAYQSAALFPYSSLAAIPFYNEPATDSSESRRHIKRPRKRYHLDVGAFGIPKRTSRNIDPASEDAHSQARGLQQEDLSLAVQVGEDAYFIRENAMGVADGVGGWSRTRGAFTMRAIDPPL